MGKSDSLNDTRENIRRLRTNLIEVLAINDKVAATVETKLLKENISSQKE